MERTKYLVIAFVLWFTVTKAQTYNKDKIYNAYINGEMSQWKQIIDEMEEKTDKTKTFTLDLVNYHYGYIAWCIGNDKDQQAEEYLKKAQKHIERLERQNYKLSVVYAYKSAFIGFEIGLNPFYAPFIGSKSIEYAELAIEKNKKTHMAYIQLGNAQYYMPEMFGGSKTKAIDYYLKAKSLMENDKNNIEKNWNYLNLLIIIAQAYTETGKKQTAKEYYQKILAIEPGFQWAKDGLRNL